MKKHVAIFKKSTLRKCCRRKGRGVFAAATRDGFDR
jgi:hypothetical protein